MTTLRQTSQKALAERSARLLTSRRAFLLAGAGAGVAGAAAFLAQKPSASAQLGRIDGRNAAPLGDGFYLVDGWVLTADDLGGDVAREAAAPPEPR